MADNPVRKAGDNRHRIIRKGEMLRLMLLVFGIAAAACVLLLQLAQGYLASVSELARTNPGLAAQQIAGLLRLVLVGMVILAIGAGAMVVRYGVRAVRTECFPPPGSWVVEGREIYTGEKARRLGRWQIVLGIVMASTSGFTVYFGSKLLSLL